MDVLLLGGETGGARLTEGGAKKKKIRCTGQHLEQRAATEHACASTPAQASVRQAPSSSPAAQQRGQPTLDIQAGKRGNAHAATDKNRTVIASFFLQFFLLLPGFPAYSTLLRRGWTVKQIKEASRVDLAGFTWNQPALKFLLPLAGAPRQDSWVEKHITNHELMSGATSSSAVALLLCKLPVLLKRKGKGMARWGRLT